MASTSLSESFEKPSFAKIAATGLKPPNIQHAQILSNPNHQRTVPSTFPRDETSTISINGHMHPSGAPAVKRLAQVVQQDPRNGRKHLVDGPSVIIQTIKRPSPQVGEIRIGGLLNPPSGDDAGTQVSSSSDSIKPQSLDGKSVASGTTFAMDEKESLRPDDSASVKAAEEDDVFIAQPGSRAQSDDDGIRAFSDQLREISTMDASRRAIPPPIFGSMPRPALYNPTPGPTVGIIPSVVQEVAVDKTALDFQPDQKLVDALDNPRDRVWVLKLEQDVIDFVKDAKESSLNLPQCNSFYRMLAHKMADYYTLGHVVDDSSAAVRLYKLPGSRIPPPLTGMTASSTAASTPPPAAPPMRILRRGVDRAGLDLASGASSASKNGSENDDGNDDGKKKLPASREEREARYEAARLRIMGSAKPSESPDTTAIKQSSRSSSANGRKTKKKGRIDSDDDFEARSAYSNIYGTQYGADQLTSSPYGYTDFGNSADMHYASNSHSQANTNGHGSHYTGQMPGNGYWAQQPMVSPDSMQSWGQVQHPSYDLSADFQRSMTFTQQAPPHASNASFNPSYGQQYMMPQQQYPLPSPGMQPWNGNGYGAAPNHMHEGHPSYAYGQLPSQTFPGRPASQMEHPLPGSYKSKHFNPQSQSFIPGQTSNSGNSSPFPARSVLGGTSTVPSNPNVPEVSSPYFNNPATSQKMPFGSPRHATTPSSNANNSRLHGSSSSMMHPLPQPVFVRQPSPHVPLPPKPGLALPPSTAQKPSDQQQQHQNPHDFSRGSAMQMPYQPSMINKWSLPPSLPAKPPPATATDPFDAARFQRPQQQSFQSDPAANDVAGKPFWSATTGR